MRLLLSLARASLTFSGVAKAQDIQPKEVSAQSWQKGRETIANQMIGISLSNNQKEYVTEIMGSSGQRYKLHVIYNPLSSVKTDHWKIELREVLSTPEGKDAPGDNLLEEPPGPGRHYFPRQDFIGYLYPEKEPPMVWVGGTPLVEAFPFYSIKTTRKIRVERFYLIAKVENYQYNYANKNTVDFLNLNIEFRNVYEQESRSRRVKE